MSNQRPIAYHNPTLILKFAPGIDKHIIPNRNILSKICVKWRKQPKIPTDRLPYQI